MKRALAIAVALCTIGFAGFSQIAMKGSWSASLCFSGTNLTTLTLDSTLTLTYSVAGFDVTSTTKLSQAGLTGQSFALKGVFGPFSITGGMWFDPTNILYQRASLVTSFEFGGVAIGLTAYHAAIPWSTGWGWGADPCAGQTPSLKYILSGTIGPITAKMTFIDCCTGTEFDNLNVTLKGLGLCCGITYNIEFDFLKTGFNYVNFTGINVPICCGVSFDIGVKYTTTTKVLSVTPKFAGIGEACFTVWGGPKYSGNYNQIWEGIEIYGFAIKCTIADCNYLEFVNAYNITEVNKKLPAADRFLTACGEFELVKIGFCGPGCCGGKYDVTLRVFFGTGGGLFDITRFVYDVKIPIMTNFTLNLSGTMPALAGCATATFCIGWTFTF